MRSKIALRTEYSGFPRPFRRRLTRYTTVSAASRFEPQPNETPETHFPLQTVNHLNQPRYINRYNSREILIVTDGSCLNNGNSSYFNIPPSGGCSFKYKGGSTRGTVTSFPFLQDCSMEAGGTVGFPLEHRGPGGEFHDPTSNRAKLRAVIAALEFRPWHEEGWRRIVIATNLEYVVHGAIYLLPVWVKNGWRRARRSRMVRNRDLWEELHGAIENLSRHGTKVSFWLINRHSPARDSEIVKDAKSAAQGASWQFDAAAIEFTRLLGIQV